MENTANSIKLEYPDINVNLYHYTSLGSLLAILQNKTIRLTDYRFLNDTQELSFATQKLKSVLLALPKDNRIDDCLKIITNIENGYLERLHVTEKHENFIHLEPEISKTRYYLLSLSTVPDNLPMWRMYAHNGCCIKFSSSKLREYFSKFLFENFTNGNPEPIAGSISYGEIDYDIEFLHSILSSKERISYNDILRHCLLRKDSAFSYENEYRIGVTFEDQFLGDTITKEFSLIGNVIKPQLELKQFPVADIIEEIIISPFVTSELTNLGIQELVLSKGLSPEIVHHSAIQIR